LLVPATYSSPVLERLLEQPLDSETMLQQGSFIRFGGRTDALLDIVKNVQVSGKARAGVRSVDDSSAPYMAIRVPIGGEELSHVSLEGR
jgi:hypothetical protein